MYLFRDCYAFNNLIQSFGIGFDIFIQENKHFTQDNRYINKRIYILQINLARAQQTLPVVHYFQILTSKICSCLICLWFVSMYCLMVYEYCNFSSELGYLVGRGQCILQKTYPQFVWDPRDVIFPFHNDFPLAVRTMPEQCTLAHKVKQPAAVCILLFYKTKGVLKQIWLQ